MILSKGTNQFPNNEFSFWEWSAPILQTPEEALQKLKELQLEGRVIKDIISVGMGYGWTEDNICSVADHVRDRFPTIIRKHCSEAEALLSSDCRFECRTTIDEPMLIVFEDGDILGISFDEGSCVRMELNTIPVTVSPGTNPKSVHTNKLFQSLIGKRIEEASVNATSVEPYFTWSHGLELEDQPFYIDSIVLKCSDNSVSWRFFSFKFQAWMDYGTVELLNHDGETIAIPAEQIPQLVDGYSASEFFQNVSEKKVAALKWIYKHFGRKRNG